MNENLPTRSETNAPILANRHARPTGSAVLAGLGYVAAAGGFYEGWFLAAFAAAAVGTIALVRYAAIRVSRHEQSVSTAPALGDLQLRLGNLQVEPSVREYAERAQTQLRRLQEAWRLAKQTLDRKLAPGELAYSRFEGGFTEAAGTVFQALLAAAEKMKQIALLSASSDEIVRSKASLSSALDENEKALEAFMSAIASISEMKTESAQAEMPEAIEQLKYIAARAHRLSLQQGDRNE